MHHRLLWLKALGLGLLLASPSMGETIYSNLTPNNMIAMATRPDTGGLFEIETGDDFVVGSQTSIMSASFVGLLVSGTGGLPSVQQLVVEMYRVFPSDSNLGRTPNVPTRLNSPSDVAFDSRDSASNELTFTTMTLSQTFTALNSVKAGGIHASPNQATLGNGPVTGQEVQFTATFLKPFDLPADHYFFVPQVAVSNGGDFYWLSASRPISGAGTTPFAPDLQVWTRDQFLDPDWLRAGTDIVGGASTFNAAFALQGATIPEPSSLALMMAAFAMIGIQRYRVARN